MAQAVGSQPAHDARKQKANLRLLEVVTMRPATETKADWPRNSAGAQLRSDEPVGARSSGMYSAISDQEHPKNLQSLSRLSVVVLYGR